jgi:hypothetical protein
MSKPDMLERQRFLKFSQTTAIEDGVHTYGVVIIAGLFASLLASVLLLDLRSVFYVDWNNHLWSIEYFGESIKHLTIPDVINTKQLIGMPITLFYAQKFYALSGLLSAFFGSAITIRIMVFMVFFLQFFQVYRAAMKTGSTQKTSICIAVIVTWAIYPLTNLYNRSALTEFFSLAFLTCSLASLLCVIINARGRISRYDIVATGLFYVAAAITHPLTALFGGLFLCILGATALFFCERKRKLWFLAYFSITAFLSLLILSPWIYLLYQFNDKLPISARKYNATVFQASGFFPNSIDNILSRLSPFPLDLRSIHKGVQDVSTPYLDAQVALPLIILIAIFIYIGLREKSARFSLGTCERAIIWGSAAMLIMVFVVSVYPKVSGWLGGFFDILQFPYRLTSYVNLSALVVLIVLAGRISGANVNNKQVINICLAFCIAISFSALILKLVHASAISGKSMDGKIWAPLPFGSNRHLNELPASYCGAAGYSIEDGFAKEPASGTVPITHQDFNVLDGTRFGQVEPLTVNHTEPTLVIRNVQPFPWNQIVIDDSPQSQSGTIVAEGREAILLPQGRHRLEVVTLNDGIWKLLNLLSWVLLFLWIAIYTIFVFAKFVGNSRIYCSKEEHS